MATNAINLLGPECLCQPNYILLAIAFITCINNALIHSWCLNPVNRGLEYLDCISYPPTKTEVSSV